MKLMKHAKFTEFDLLDYAAHIQLEYFRGVSNENPGNFHVTFEPGTKYTRVVTWNYASRSAHSFIDAEGQIWKSASWKAPARNFPRGHIVTKEFNRVTWTGAQ